MVIRGNKILLGRRKNSHGNGEYGGPGGHLENGESIAECALRELAEEAGTKLKVTQPKFLCVINLTQYAPKHYLHISLVANWQAGEAVDMEPDKKAWGWYDLDHLPSPLFATTLTTIEAYKTGQTFYDTPSYID